MNVPDFSGILNLGMICSTKMRGEVVYSVASREHNSW